MAQTLAPLRRNLELQPSPVADRPGLLVRDPYRYAPGALIIPPPLVPLLGLFDGRTDVGDLHMALVRLTGDIRAGSAADHLASTLSSGGFLEDDVYAGLKDGCERAFVGAPVREPVHAGAAYPAEPGELRSILASYLDGAENTVAARNRLVAIAAPHVTPEGGHRSYGAAYGSLEREHQHRTFVILGTSHYGEPETFGLTRKPFVTPYGQTETALDLVSLLESEGGEAVRVEDYCHAIEHSIEFQAVFLQHVIGPNVRILPILCGPFARALCEGGSPEDDPGVDRFLGALRSLVAREGDRLLFVLGVDMAHMGRRYGDPFAAEAGSGLMVEVGERDAARLARIAAQDAPGFWDLLRENEDDLKWCGASPFYTFLRTAPSVVGTVLHYEQWNIDDASVVSFAGLAFRERAGA